MDRHAHAPQWSPGARIGDYEIVDHIATGGMAEVYAAVPRGGGELVVVKAMSRSLLVSDEFIRMFLDEARLVATLRHPHIGQIYDRGEHGGTHYFVMEYVQGASCRELLNRAVRGPAGYLPLPHALEICSDIAGALHYAHERRSVDGRSLGIVHRDVSHSNLLITFEGVAKLIDFGVAKSSMRSTETRAGSLKGKVRYMSPEQIRGEPLDGRSDLFSLAIVLWEMTTGQRLFVAENEAATLHKILYEPIPLPSNARPGYPAELEQVVMQALGRNRQDRQASCQVFAEQLAEVGRRLRLARGGLASYVGSLFGDEIAQAQRRTAELQRRSRTQIPLRPPPSSTMPATRAGRPTARRPGLLANAQDLAQPPALPPGTAPHLGVAPWQPAAPVSPFFGGLAPQPVSPVVGEEAPPPVPFSVPIPIAASPIALPEPHSATRVVGKQRERSLLLFAAVVVVIIAGGLALSRLASPGAPTQDRPVHAPARH